MRLDLNVLLYALLFLVLLGLFLGSLLRRRREERRGGEDAAAHGRGHAASPGEPGEQA